MRKSMFKESFRELVLRSSMSEDKRQSRHDSRSYARGKLTACDGRGILRRLGEAVVAICGGYDH